MPRTEAVVGTDAVAEAMRQGNPDVVAAYPITPQTSIVESYSQMVADGRVNTHLINVESEHSAMSACIGAAAGGGRVMTATSSQGLALMWELLYIASGLRLPIVMPNVNRALSAPINIHCDHSDSMGARDSGWIQLFSENGQEAYDNVLQAIRIAEHPAVKLPVMVNLDGFIISHSIDRVEFLDDEVAQKFIGNYTPAYSLLRSGNPICVGGFDGLYGNFLEFKRAQEEGMIQSRKIIKEVGEEFGEISGRSYGFFETHALEDAEIAIVALGSSAGTVRFMVDCLRENGFKIGLLKLRTFRPFPAEDLLKALTPMKAVAVLDRSNTFAGGLGGPVFSEIRSSFYESSSKPLLVNFVYGLGGRDLSQQLVEEVAKELQNIARLGTVTQSVQYLGLKE